MRHFVIALLIAATAFAASPSRTDVVSQLYRDWNDGKLLEQPAKTLHRYFDDRLVKLILKNRECDQKTKEICALDFDPIWNTQDEHGDHLRVAAGSKPDTVLVTFRVHGTTRTDKLIYRVTKSNDGWRISDIVYSGQPSLVQMLSQNH